MANDNGNGTDTEATNVAPMTQAEFLKGLLAGGKLPKGYGSKVVLTFIEESDEPFINPREVFPLLKDKKVDSVYQLLNSARNESDELKEVVRVKKFDNEVYLIHNERAGTLLDDVEEDEVTEPVEEVEA